MAENVIRQDVIEVAFDTNLKELIKLQDELNALKKKLSGDMGGDAFDDLKDSANKAVTPLEKVKKQAEKVTKSVTEIGKKAATTAFRGLKKLAGISFKALTAGIGAAATAIGGLVAKSVTAYADFEQLVGGVETLLGAKGAKSVEEYAKLVGKSVDSVKNEYNKLKESENTVITNANNAYKTAGLSANAYMETVTGFSASLLQSVNNDTQKAAELADMAISDMADNANKMGTDMSSIQWAYQGFAKQNYTILDNLKLGYGGTKGEMKRLVKDAAKLDKSINANSLSYGNIVKAIHAVQVQTGIYGTTQKEAEHTIQGSLNSMKSAWGNLMPALIQGGDQFDQCVENLIDSIDIFADNIMPAVQKALGGVGTLIEKLAPKIEEKLPSLVEDLLPPLIRASVSLVSGLIKALPSIVKTVANEIPNIFKELGQTIIETFGKQFPIVEKFGNFFKNIGEFFKENATAVKIFIGALAGLPIAFKAFKGIKSITSLFGKFSKGGSEKSGDGFLGGLKNIFETLAKTKTTTILKGMANLAIIIGGFTLITAAIMALSPYMATLTDTKSFVKVVGAISVLGLVGAGLAKLGEIAGNIPVAKVAKGLANMAIMIAGMSALFLLIGAVSLINFDLKKITQITAIIGLLGTVGAALSIFAGIVGLIPIPVVLSGLANIALALGGMTAIISAYGALAQIPHFDEFISKGGDTLANIFEQIGKIAGALVGSFGEKVSSYLPQIGKNLASFAENIKPLFTMFDGVDTTGIGNFFVGFAAFIGALAADKIVSIFGGGTDFEAISKGLGALAGDGTKAFFTMVKGIEEPAFTNSKLFFDALDKIGSLPNMGGLAQKIFGTNDFTGVANGLGQLAGEGVKNFFAMVASMEDPAFENAKKFFSALNNIGALPNVGGVAQEIFGKNDFEGVATGLGQLASEGVKNFFEMVSALKPEAFTNTTALFKALSDISKLPNSGGLWDSIKEATTGNKTKSKLATIADDLSYFAKEAKDFFTQVNGLNIDNLNGLWASLKKPSEISTNTLKVVSQNIDKIVDKCSKLPSQMGEAIKSAGNSFVSAIKSIWKEATTASNSGASQVAKSANWILGQLGSNKKIATSPYAKGTNGHKGGNALVNDGRGAELVQMPNGNTFIPQGRNVFIPNAPKGMKVLTAEQTAQLMGKKSPTFKYANGTGDIDVFSYIDNAKGLVAAVLKKFVNYDNLSGFPLSIKKGTVSTASEAMTAWTKKQLDEIGAMSIAAYNASKGVEQWRAVVIRALKMEGQYSPANVARTLYQMQTESGGNPRAINLWDSNAKKGIPSKGLMQVIDPTFKAYARAGFNKNIYDPLSNILASIRYAISKYGSLARAYRGVGYENGGLVTQTGTIAENPRHPEWVIPTDPNKKGRALDLYRQAGQSLGLSSYTPESDSNYYTSNSNVENNTYAPVFNLTISGSNDDRILSRKVKGWINEAMEETFEGMARRSPKVREV